jgi:hypothetical protein
MIDLIWGRRVLDLVKRRAQLTDKFEIAHRITAA